ncbi:dicarboxylate/amino acid:cation symporter [Desulfovibrio aminophilus]|nr:dicarboxylate/amino acid:cation symporter [Desulfovibrio aminophilus]MCM0754047.1 dicarboxylate/amino acid:cation symporter [Desulfovibrio aminophilus]
MKLWMKILIGMAAGTLFGLLFKAGVPYVEPLGALFIKGIKLLIVPLVFASLVTGMTSMENIRQLGRISLKTFTIYMATTACAVSVGLFMSWAFQPGAGMGLAAPQDAAAKVPPSVVETLLDMVPANPLAGMVEGNILQIITFAILLGLSMNLAGQKSEPVRRFCESLAEIMYSMTSIVISFAPVGVFALMAKVVAQYGLEALLPLAKIIFLVYGGCLLHMVLVYGGSVGLLARLNPLRFFRGSLDAQLVAFSTSSSSGTLPATIRCAEQNLGVSKSVASFVLPLGATINMDGTAIYQGVCAVFVAQAYGVDLTVANYATIVLTATLASIGTAGVPGAGLIMLSLILSSIGLPMEGLALIAGIDRILDMARTTVNVTGDAMTALLVAKSEGELDMAVYEANGTAAEDSATAQ